MPVVESWDDDCDLQGDLFANSTFGAGQNVAAKPLSSRASMRSESNVGEEDWQMLIAPNDPASKFNAISSAKQVGIPIPKDVPSTALLGGSIKRLGKKKSKKDVSDDWGEDFDMPDAGPPTLKLRQMNPDPGAKTPALDQEEFDSEWAEGSLGFRHAGRRDTRGRSSSVSAMSPSMASCMTLESEEDDLGGLVLPTEPVDFGSLLKKRKAVDYDTPAPAVKPLNQQQLQSRDGRSFGLPSKAAEDDDMMAGLDFGGDLLDTKKRKINRNIKIKQPKTSTPATRTATTLTFTDKPVSKIPRPTPPPARINKLDTVPESNITTQQSRLNRLNRPAPQTTTGAQLLRSKRSAPLLGARQPASARPPVPFLPAGVTPAQSHHITSKASSSHLRTPSDHYDRPHSPPPSRSSVRPGSSAQSQHTNDSTPSRTGFRRDGPSASLLRQVASQRNLQVTKRKTFGDGSELDRFDDLPTSATKESRYVKEPVNRDRVGPGKTLRSVGSRRNLSQQHSTSVTPVPPSISSASSTMPSTPLTTAAPPTPKGYFPTDSTPRFARDTAASRNAREQRLGGTRTRGAGPIEAVAINWKAQIAARSPQTSPSAQRQKKRGEGKQPFLIKNMGGVATKHEKGMIYNPATQRWEGNEHALTRFENPSTSTLPLHPTHKNDHTRHHHTNSIPSALLLDTNPVSGGNNFQTITNAAAAASAALAPKDHNIVPPARHGSPPRPALISQINNVRGVVVERGMVFDPQRMTWLKLDSKLAQQHAADPAVVGLGVGGGHGPGSVVSFSVEEEEDVFAGLDDLVDERTAKVAPGAGAANWSQDKENSANQQDWAVGEEFDLGPAFVRRQRAEEQEWRRKVDRWMVGREQGEDQAWRWEIRRVAERYDMRI